MSVNVVEWILTSGRMFMWSSIKAICTPTYLFYRFLVVSAAGLFVICLYFFFALSSNILLFLLVLLLSVINFYWASERDFWWYSLGERTTEVKSLRVRLLTVQVLTENPYFGSLILMLQVYSFALSKPFSCFLLFSSLSHWSTMQGPQGKGHVWLWYHSFLLINFI